MSKCAIIYATMTKHSKKIAEAVGKAIQADPQNVKSNPSLGDIDTLFIVGGIYGGESSPELVEYVKKLDAAKIRRAALVTSSASDKKGQDSIRSILEDKGIPVVDEIRCLGGFLFMRMGHPNKNEVSQAVDFAVKLSGNGVKS